MNLLLDNGKIKADAGTQPRLALCKATVEHYADCIKAGDVFPAVDVFYDGTNYWLASGFHRLAAHQLAGKSEIECNIHDGTIDDAKWFACSKKANGQHGLHLSNADKRRAVERALTLPNGAGLSDRQIAEHVGVSHTFVAKLRQQLESTGNVASSERRVGLDGKSRPVAPAKPEVGPNCGIPQLESGGNVATSDPEEGKEEDKDDICGASAPEPSVSEPATPPKISGGITFDPVELNAALAADAAPPEERPLPARKPAKETDCDPNGVPLQGPSAEAFKILDDFAYLRRLLLAASKQLEEMAAKPGGEDCKRRFCAHKGDEVWKEKTIRELVKDISHCLPFTLCPFCVGRATSCLSCQGTGWITEFAFKNQADERKAKVNALRRIDG